MIVMPANSSGWPWHCLARETGVLGHLYSPGGQRGPWPWFPYALDNGAYSAWDRHTGRIDEAKLESMLARWERLIVWAQVAAIPPRWAIVPDVPGNAERTFERWHTYAPSMPFARALAVQDGMSVETVRELTPAPDVIAVGGTTEWKWGTVAQWAAAFPRVHLLRCNSPTRLYELEALGVESCDGTGWARGDRKQTSGLEEYLRSRARPVDLRAWPVWPYTCRKPRGAGKFGTQTLQQESFA